MTSGWRSSPSHHTSDGVARPQPAASGGRSDETAVRGEGQNITESVSRIAYRVTRSLFPKIGRSSLYVRGALSDCRLMMPKR